MLQKAKTRNNDTKNKMTEIWQKQKMTETIKIGNELKILDKIVAILNKPFALIRRGSEVQVLLSAPFSSPRGVTTFSFLLFSAHFCLLFGRNLSEGFKPSRRYHLKVRNARDTFQPFQAISSLRGCLYQIAKRLQEKDVTTLITTLRIEREIYA